MGLADAGPSTSRRLQGRAFAGFLAVMAAFERPGGGSVLNVGVTDWVLGLGDPVVERITRNVLDRLSR